MLSESVDLANFNNYQWESLKLDVPSSSRSKSLHNVLMIFYYLIKP